MSVNASKKYDNEEYLSGFCYTQFCHASPPQQRDIKIYRNTTTPTAAPMVSFIFFHHIARCRFLLVVLNVTELAERFSVLSTRRSSFSPLSMITSILATMMSFT